MTVVVKKTPSQNAISPIGSFAAHKKIGKFVDMVVFCVAQTLSLTPAFIWIPLRAVHRSEAGMVGSLFKVRQSPGQVLKSFKDHRQAEPLCCRRPFNLKDLLNQFQIKWPTALRIDAPADACAKVTWFGKMRGNLQRSMKEPAPTTFCSSN